MAQIPFLDLVAPHRALEPALTEVFHEVLESAGFVGGRLVEQFESEFAEFCGTRYCVGVGSGTDALRFSLIAAGIEPGDTVLTVPNTFIATTEAISQAGATPEFIDISSRSCNISVDSLRTFLLTRCIRNPQTGYLHSRRTGNKVTAVIPVHLYGHMADMDPILALAEEHRLIVVEDACQAHGAEYYSQRDRRWHRAGSLGKAAAFSFYPGKNLGACGEAGAITTDDQAVAWGARMLRDHGQARKYYHDCAGFNGRLDALQAGILRVKLKFLPEWTAQRRAAAALYTDLLAPLSNKLVALPEEPCWSKSVYHLYVIRCKQRDALRQALAAQGIETGIHYPIPLHLQKAFAGAGYQRGDFPACETAAEEVLSLPMFPTIQREQQERVVEQVACCADLRASL